MALTWYCLLLQKLYKTEMIMTNIFSTKDHDIIRYFFKQFLLHTLKVRDKKTDKTYLFCHHIINNITRLCLSIFTLLYAMQLMYNLVILVAVQARTDAVAMLYQILELQLTWATTCGPLSQRGNIWKKRTITHNCTQYLQTTP